MRYDPETLRRVAKSFPCRACILDHVSPSLIVFDLSSQSPTGSFKDCVAAITVADCVNKNLRTVIAQSSGNTGLALLHYANTEGIRIVLLYPRESRYKFDVSLFDRSLAVLVEFTGTETELKLYADRLSKSLELPLVPTFAQQLDGNWIRFLAYSKLVESNGRVDWQAQALSSGYGPIGFYTHELTRLRNTHLLPELPRFLGLHQEARSPFVVQGNELPSNIHGNRQLVEPTLFRTEPGEVLRNRMRQLLKENGGEILVVPSDYYYSFRYTAIQDLFDLGITVAMSRVQDRTIPKEQAPLIAYAGLSLARHTGLVSRTESALLVFTGGAKAVRENLDVPDISLAAGEPIASAQRRIRSALRG